jgi:Domain of unknown function (DUF1735)
MQKIITAILIMAIMSGCKKEGVVEPISSTGGTTAIKFSIATPTSIYPKINYVPNGTAAQYLSLEDNDIKVKFEAPILAPNDIYLTYGINAAGIAKLNAEGLANDPANYKPYFLLPDSTYQILVTKDTIKKGQQYAEKIAKNIVVYTQKINPAINYMLPLTVTSSSYPSAVGTGTIYYYIIGNPLAGAYSVAGIRYNYNGGPSGASGTFDGNPANIPQNYTGTTAIPASKTAVPIDGNTVTIDFANLGANGYSYILKQKNNFASIDVNYNTLMINGDSNIRTWLVSYTAPSSTQKAKFRIITQYINNADPAVGNDRILDETFTQK